jgi:glycosyltransferase involved in cell wall biosynthesis
MEVSIVIPIGPFHADVAARAIASAENQSTPCRVITAHDPDGRGAGWARNQGLRKVQTSWVLFLDADDWLEVDAVERLLWQAGQTPGRYIYSDWWSGDVWIEAPNTGAAWCGGTWHAISALLPLQWVESVSGFNEALPAAEDTEFFMRLTTSRRCGVRLPEPLLHYSGDGQRSRFMLNTPGLKDEIWKGFTKAYGGKMGCCGEVITIDNNTGIGVQQPGDVLAMALWGGNQIRIGAVSNRRYPRTGNGKLVWIDPRDATAQPNLWRVVDGGPEPVNAQQVVTDIAQLADIMQGGQTIRYRPERNDPPPARPDVERIIRMGMEALG